MELEFASERVFFRNGSRGYARPVHGEHDALAQADGEEVSGAPAGWARASSPGPPPCPRTRAGPGRPRSGGRSPDPCSAWPPPPAGRPSGLPRWSRCGWVRMTRSSGACTSSLQPGRPGARRPPGGPPSMSTVLPVGETMSAASPWPTSKKYTVSGLPGAGGAGAGCARPGGGREEDEEEAEQPGEGHHRRTLAPATPCAALGSAQAALVRMLPEGPPSGLHPPSWPLTR